MFTDAYRLVMFDTLTCTYARKDHIFFASKFVRYERKDRAPDDLVFRIAEDALGPGVPTCDNSLERFTNDPVIRRRDYGCKAARGEFVGMHADSIQVVSGGRVFVIIWHIPL